MTDSEGRRELIENLKRVPGGVFSRGFSHDDHLPIGTWCAQAAAELAGKDQEIARLKIEHQALLEKRYADLSDFRFRGMTAEQLTAMIQERTAKDQEIAELRAQLVHAPELLETLKQCKFALEDAFKIVPDEDYEAVIGLAETAIRKAEEDGE